MQVAAKRPYRYQVPKLTLIGALLSVSVLAGCNGKSKASLPLGYSIVMDAGSGGTRAYFYEAKKRSTGQIEVAEINLGQKHWVKAADKLSNGAQTLEPLVAQISAFLADNKIDIRKVHVSVLATAGMREPGNKAKADQIYAEARTILNRTGMQVDDIRTISGTEEGIYAWAAINADAIVNGGDKTRGIFEIGGASMQLAFADPDLENGPNTVKYKIDNKEYTLFSNSVMNLGADKARERIAGLRSDGGDLVCYPRAFEPGNGNKGKEGGNYDGVACQQLYKDLLVEASQSPNEDESTKSLTRVSAQIYKRPFVALGTPANAGKFLRSQTDVRLDKLTEFDYPGIRQLLARSCNAGWRNMVDKAPEDAKYAGINCANTTLSYALAEEIDIDPAKIVYLATTQSWPTGYMFLKYRGEKQS